MDGWEEEEGDNVGLTFYNGETSARSLFLIFWRNGSDGSEDK